MSVHGLLCVLMAANVDLETDSKIQAAIRTVFRASTVITVAHRLGRLSFLARRKLCLYMS
jgi:ABC-type multidrug transport system fused ATPase/permease subunit